MAVAKKRAAKVVPARRKGGAVPPAKVGHIVEALRPLAVPVASLVLDPANARRHPQRNIDAVKRSLSEFGQRVPLVVQKDGMIVRAGNARLQAALELGWEYVAAVVVDDAEGMAIAFGLMDNRTSDLAEWDFSQVGALLREMQESGTDLLLSGFEEFESRPLMGASWSPPVVGEGVGAGDEDKPKSHSITFSPTQFLVVVDSIATWADQSGTQDAPMPEAVTGVCAGYTKSVRGKK